MERAFCFQAQLALDEKRYGKRVKRETRVVWMLLGGLEVEGQSSGRQGSDSMQGNANDMEVSMLGGEVTSRLGDWTREVSVLGAACSPSSVCMDNR